MTYFDSRQVPKCRDRIEKAKKALFECRSAKTYSEYTSAWASFLVHTGSIIHALQAGAAATPQGRQWYGGVVRFGRGDPLISYMHQARNTEEHEATPVAGNAMMPGFGLVNHQTNRLEPLESLDDPWKPENAGKTLGIGFHGAGPFLKEVTDTRFRQVFPAPGSHDGKPLKSHDPVYAGEVYLDYLCSVVSTVEGMA